MPCPWMEDDYMPNSKKIDEVLRDLDTDKIDVKQAPEPLKSIKDRDLTTVRGDKGGTASCGGDRQDGIKREPG